MSHTYDEVTSRHLSKAERRVPTEEERTPLVIEPLKSSSMEFLTEFLQHNSSQFFTDLAKDGAVLLRGFSVDSAADFERAILSIRGTTGVHEMLLSEPGREVVEGTRFVLYTNALFKTGGTLSFGGFHTENYYLPEVPRYIAFFCEVPGKLGGETGLVNDVKLYAALPKDLQCKLESRACVAGVFSVADVMSRYGLSADLLEEFCKETNLPICDIDGRRYVSICKPNVIEHPLTQERALQINFGEVPGLSQALMHSFLPDYSGVSWLAHRVFWRYPWLSSWSTRRVVQRLRLAARDGKGSTPDKCAPDAHSLNRLFSTEDVQILATCMRRYYSSFPWKRGDILVVDNFKIAHSGMAGIGRRELKAIMCNPHVLSVPATSPGFSAIPNRSEVPQGLDTHLLHLKERRGVLH